jgi:hypothetical protein
MGKKVQEQSRNKQRQVLEADPSLRFRMTRFGEVEENKQLQKRNRGSSLRSE